MANRSGADPGVAAIDLLIVDVHDVIYRYDPSRRIELLADLTHTTPGAVRIAVFESGLEDRSDAGELAADEYLDAVGERLGRSVDVDSWVRSFTGALVPMTDTIRLMRDVRPLIDVVALSNNGLIVKEQARQLFPILDQLDVELFVSAEFGVSKPHDGVYLAVCDRVGVDPHRTAFVDDKRAHADGAVAAGLHGHQFTTVDEMGSFLAGLGVRPRR